MTLVTDWCNAHNGTYGCKRKPDHTGDHACHVLGGVAYWAGPYDRMTTRKVDLERGVLR